VFDLAAFSDIKTGKAMVIWYIDVGADVWIVLDILVGHSGHKLSVRGAQFNTSLTLLIERRVRRFHAQSLSLL
jgi:hypothetical protein